MVVASDLKVYKTTSNLGGAITGTQVISATPNNLFSNVPKNELTIGEDYYACVFLKNTHSTEKMDNFTLWETDKSFPHDTEMKWGYDSMTSMPMPMITFDGTNDYIDCTNDATLWSQSLTKFSFTTWIYPMINNLSSRRLVQHNAALAQGFNLFLASPTSLNFEIRSAANASFTSTFTGLPLAKWSHIACVYDNSLGSANIKLYVNGTLAGSTGNLTEAINASAALLLANSANGFQGHMNGFKWWTTKALSSTEVTKDMNNAIDAVTPDYWLKMMEGTGTTTMDTISGTKMGTLTNGAAWMTDSNISVQTIADKFTAPLNITWKTLGAQPDVPDFDLMPTAIRPIWLWYHVNANAVARLDDSTLFAFSFDIPQGGTGTPGGGDTGGSGGNPPPVNTNYKVAIAGDWGCETETDDVVDLVTTGGYDILVGVGDNAYASASCWTTRFKPLHDAGKFPISAYGNHEYEESGGITPYKTFFGDNTTYYVKKFQNILFAVFDGNIDFSSGSAQNTKMTTDINAADTDNTITWRIGIVHFPMFGASSNHSYNNNNFNQVWQTYLQNKKFSIVCTGHNHNWQRSNQVIYNSNNPLSPTTVASASPFSRMTTGIIHVVSGTGGHDSGSGLYSLGSQPSFQGYQNRTNNGIWEIVASNNAQTLTCSFVNVGGDKFDTITINA